MRARIGEPNLWIRLGWLFLMVLLVLGAQELFLRGFGTGDGEFIGLTSFKWGIGLIGFGFVGLAAFIIAGYGLIYPERTSEWLGRIERWLRKYRFIQWPIMLLALLLPSLLLLGPWGWRFDLPVFRLLIIILCSFAAGLAMPDRKATLHGRIVLSSFLSISILIAIHRLGQITDYPFGVGWSEGNRLWDYSLYFRRDLYTISGEFYYPTYLTPGRHGLWGLPFLFFSNPSIELLRYWDALLWLIPYLVLGIVTFVLKRNSLTRTWGWIFALWTLLFLLQGPIYAPLVISALLIVVAYDREKPWRTIVITFIACFYAGISRWTWMLAPAIWAGLWALLDEEEDLEWTRRIRFTVILGVAGVAGALAAQLFMNLAFPRPDTVYSTTLSQPLLWYRLWSSPTNPTGIVPGLLYALGPLTLWLLWVIISRRLKWSALQILGVTAALLVFLGVGLAASVKIGGGSNLHNMDMLLVTFVVLLGIIMICEGVFRDMPGYAWALLALAAIIPIWNLMNFEVDQDLPTKEDAKFALATVRACVEQATEEGEVLFIDQRQLLTFGQIQDAPLVMDYELKHMMNQAMSGNREYFEAFERDLEEHRFILIVSDPLHIVYQGKEIPFGEENDLWVDAVTVPILEHYEPVLKLNDVDIWLLMPENEDGICVGM